MDVVNELIPTFIQAEGEKGKKIRRASRSLPGAIQGFPKSFQGPSEGFYKAWKGFVCSTNNFLEAEVNWNKLLHCRSPSPSRLLPLLEQAGSPSSCKNLFHLWFILWFATPLKKPFRPQAAASSGTSLLTLLLQKPLPSVVYIVVRHSIEEALPPPGFCLFWNKLAHPPPAKTFRSCG